MSRAWMPFYVGDYLRDTMHLSTLEHGMYLRLILHYWEHGSVPETTAGRSRVAGVPWQTFRDHEITLAGFFQHPGWRHKRIDAELVKDEKKKKDRSIGGSKGGTATMIAWNLRQPSGQYRSPGSRDRSHGENRAKALPLTIRKITSSEE